MREFLCAGNWKLNKNPEATRAFFGELNSTATPSDLAQLALFLPATNLYVASELLGDTSVGWGPQNVFWETSGAFTGEISAQVVHEMGATHVLLGHSERRSLFAETSEQVANKASLVQGLGMTPVVCVGESLSERENGQTMDVVLTQVKESLALVNFDKSVLLAYEPVWAIGTGKVATPEQANEVHKHIRQFIESWQGSKTAEKIQILYGGSVKPDNAAQLSKMPDVDGFLVGGASLEVGSFLKILRSVY